MSDKRTEIQSWSLIVIVFLFLMQLSAAVMAVQSKGVDPDSKLKFWEIREKNMRLRLVQRLPDQTRAYLLSRGFTTTQANSIATSCVFQTIFENTAEPDSGKALSYDLKQWTVIHQQKKTKLKTREDWARQWEKQAVVPAARIAYHWSLFPTRQTYQAGDHNWGMAVFNLKPGAIFTLQLSWTQAGKNQARTIKGIQCSPDIHPQTGDSK